MNAPADPPTQDGFWTHWQLSRVRPNAATYATALGRTAAGNPDALPVIVSYGAPLDAVIVWIVLPSDDLACAIERSLQRLVETIDRSALDLPGRIDLIAGIQGRPPESTES